MTDYMDAHLQTPTRISFSNEVIKPLHPNKPHIVFMHGYWRVSKMPKYTTIGFMTTKDFNKAHCFVNTLNSKRLEKYV